MSYKCDICNYTTNRKSNYNRHIGSSAHNKKCIQVPSLKTKVSRNLQNSLSTKSTICPFCGNTIKHIRNLARHMKACAGANKIVNETLQEKRITEIKYENVLDKYKQVNNDYEKLQEEHAYLKERFEETLEEYLGTLKQSSDSTNIFTFVKDKKLGGKAIIQLTEKDIPQLGFIKEILEGVNGDLQFCDTIQHHIKHHTTHQFVGDHIIDTYKMKNYKDQSIWATDCSRLTYVIKELVGKNNEWVVDKKGLKLKSLVVNPILHYIRDHVMEHSQDYLKYAMKKYDQLDTIERNSRLFQVGDKVDSGLLASKIIRYVAPFFSFDKKLLSKVKPQRKRIKKKG